jgi:putative spermidine/putrescine transport system permease protein
MKRCVDDILHLGFWGLFVAALVFLLLPVLVSVGMAFDGRSYLGAFPPTSLSLRWFESFFASDYYLTGLRTSIIIALMASLISMGIGALAAFGLERSQFRGRDLLIALFLAPLVVPGVILGFGLLLFFSSFGFPQGLPRLIAGHVLITFPFCVRSTLAGLVGIRKSLSEAAMSLGANERQAFWDITFPLARTGIMAGGIFAFAISMDDVVVSLFLADPDTYTLPIALIGMMRANFDLTIAAASLVLLGLSGIVTWLMARSIGLGKVLGEGVYRPQEGNGA